METLRFLSPDQVRALRSQFGSPLFVYDEATLRQRAKEVMAFPSAFGLKIRYAMKACSNAAILQVLHSEGLGIDASSGPEVHRAMRAGIPSSAISLSSQEFPSDFPDLFDQGIDFNACSLHQLERFGRLFPGKECGLRLNPSMGSGHTQSTNTGGPTSPFGIWHEFCDSAKAIVAKHQLRVKRIHTHIGSGSDPEVWRKVAFESLNLVREFPEVTTLNLGGGYKVARMSDEIATDIQAIGQPVADEVFRLAEETNREINLEIEPGTYLVANAGCLVSTVQDLTSTGDNGFDFIKLDSGMTEILRPALYAARHPIIIVPTDDTKTEPEIRPQVVVGHCCESSDLVTTGDTPMEIQSRDMVKAQRGDLCVIEGTGAYCGVMSAKNYNSFSESPEILVRTNGDFALIRKRQTLDQILQNEVPVEW